MATKKATTDSSTSALELLKERDDLTPFGNHAFALLALETRFEIEDIADEATTALTDSKNDKKCDVLYVDRESRTAVICQAYWAKAAKTNPPANKASDLNTAVSWIFGSADSSTLEPRLAAAREELFDAIDNDALGDIELWYCHNLSSSSSAIQELDQAAQTARGMLVQRFPDANISVRGVEVTTQRVDEWLRKTHYQVLIRDLLTVPTTTWDEVAGTGWKGVVTSVSGAWLKSLYTKYGSEKLFAGNVRGDIAARKSARDINFGIQKTAKEHPDQFWAFNNGITALVTKISAAGQTLKIRGITIVNGAQTTGSLANSGASDESLKEVRVIARFIESTDRAVIRDISTYNNTQNEIRPADFRSSDPVQTRLVEQFKTIPEVVYWGPRRGGPGQGPKKPSNLLEADLVAQALAAFHGRPHVAYHEKNQIWKDNATYSQFFSDKTTAVHCVFAVSLLRAVRSLKIAIRAIQKKTGSQSKIEEFFAHRGSDFLLASAIAGCVEDVLDQAVANKWSLSFGDQVSPSVAEQHWKPIVEALANFVQALVPAAPSGNLRSDSARDKALADFQSFVSATSQANKALFETFAANVVLSPPK